MPKKESRLQKVKRYVLNYKILMAITTRFVIIILAISGTLSSAVNERELLSDQLQKQTKQYGDLQSEFDVLPVQYDDLIDAYDTL